MPKWHEPEDFHISSRFNSEIISLVILALALTHALEWNL